MSSAGDNGGSVDALGQAAELLEPKIGMSHLESNGGYIDLLGKVDVISPRTSHQLARRKWFAAIYERLWRPVVARLLFRVAGLNAKEERKIVLNMLGLSRDDLVVDIGCGPGNYTRSLAAESADGLVVGVDASEAMLAAAVKAGGPPNLAFVRADACALPFRDGQFNRVCSVGTIHMIEDPLRALDEIIRVLGPGGRLVLGVSCGPEGAAVQVRNGVTMFARDEVTGRLSSHGCVEIDQRIVGRGQFVAARKPGEAQDGC